MIFHGHVKWFDQIRGYGFITYGMDQDIFVHMTALEDGGIVVLEPGQSIAFEIQKDPKRKRESAIFLRLKL